MDFIGFYSFGIVTLLCLLIPLIHLALIWGDRRREQHIRWMFVSFGLVLLIVLAVQFQDTEAHLGVAFYTFGFWALSYMEAFSMLCRGFSLTILCDLKDREPLSSENLVRQYGGGKGAAWLFEKRLNGLIALQLVKKENETLGFASMKGRAIAQITIFYKRILKLGLGG